MRQCKVCGDLYYRKKVCCGMRTQKIKGQHLKNAKAAQAKKKIRKQDK